VGTSKRYADAIDVRMGDKADQVVMRDLEPETLTPRELALDVQPLTRTPKPMPVFAWVRYDGIPIRVSARVVAWTEKAVAVEWKSPTGLHHAWVWSSAVEPRRID